VEKYDVLRLASSRTVVDPSVERSSGRGVIVANPDYDFGIASAGRGAFSPLASHTK